MDEKKPEVVLDTSSEVTLPADTTDAQLINPEMLATMQASGGGTSPLPLQDRSNSSTKKHITRATRMKKRKAQKVARRVSRGTAWCRKG